MRRTEETDSFLRDHFIQPGFSKDIVSLSFTIIIDDER